MSIIRDFKQWWKDRFSPPDASLTVDTPEEVHKTEVRLPKLEDDVVVPPKVERRRRVKNIDIE